MAGKARVAGEGSVISHRARSRKLLFAAAIAPTLPMLGGEARGQIAYTTPGSLYTQDFNTLPASEAATPAYTIGAGKVPYQVPAQPDLSGLLTGTYTGLPGWYFTDSSPSSTTNFTVDNTSSNTLGSTYSYAHAGTVRRML